MHVNISLGMPLFLLWNADERNEFGKKLFGNLLIIFGILVFYLF